MEICELLVMSLLKNVNWKDEFVKSESLIIISIHLQLVTGHIVILSKNMFLLLSMYM